jgi:hypothetical protein
MKYLHVRSDATGRSVQEMADAPISAVTPFEGHQPIGVAAWSDAKRAMYFAAPADWAPGWHPAPCRRFVLVQAGAAEIETGDGQKTILRAGDFALFADTSGAGHHTRVLSGAPWTGLAVDF